MKFLTCVFLGISLSLFSLMSFAGDGQTSTTSSSPPQPPPKIVKKLGSPYKVQWKDGREAVFYTSPLYSTYGLAKLTIKENTCEPVIGLNCTYKVGTATGWAELKWTKHPDRQKVGRAVQIKIEELQTFLPAEGQYYFGAAHRGRVLKSGQIPLDQLSCPHWKWLDSRLQTPLEELRIDSFAQESMYFNSEINAQENMTIGSANDVRFQWKEKAYILKSFNNFWITENFIGGHLIAGEILTWKFTKSDRSSCLVSMNIDYSSFEDLIAVLVKKGKGVLKPYIYEKNELYRYSIGGALPLEGNGVALEVQ